MREKIQRFMIGRYGADELAKAQSIAALVLLFLSMFSRLGIFYWLAIALMIYSTWRMFSKNISARYAENQKYLNYRYQMAVKWRTSCKIFFSDSASGWSILINIRKRSS